MVAAVALHRAPGVDEIRKPALADRRLFGSKEAGTEGVDRDAVLRPLVGQLSGEIDNCALSQNSDRAHYPRYSIIRGES